MMARKQLIRALPAEWPVTISQANHGEEAMQVLIEELKKGTRLYEILPDDSDDIKRKAIEEL